MVLNRVKAFHLHILESMQGSWFTGQVGRSQGNSYKIMLPKAEFADCLYESTTYPTAAEQPIVIPL